MTGDVVEPVKLFQSPCLITMQNLVAFVIIPRAPMKEASKILGRRGPLSVIWGVVDPHRNSPAHACYHTPNLLALGQIVWAYAGSQFFFGGGDAGRKMVPLMARLSRSQKLTGIDRLAVGLPIVIRSNRGPIAYRFRDKG